MEVLQGCPGAASPPLKGCSGFQIHCPERRGILQAYLGISKGCACFFLPEYLCEGGSPTASSAAGSNHPQHAQSQRGCPKCRNKGAQGILQQHSGMRRLGNLSRRGELDALAQQRLGGSSEATSRGDRRGESLLTKPSVGEAPTESPPSGSSRH